ncbi:class I SAM-dependent methyltransferase [Prochlorococcus sp. AH-736-F23]|nr:class I SAM-dependent methyltransferase [Prochlorococcus sp. AH-736-F23]
MQNSSNTSYSAIEELKLVEILVNYNNEIVSNAIKYLKGSKKIVDFGAGIGTLSLIFRNKYKLDPICIEIDDENINYLSKRNFHPFKDIDLAPLELDAIFSANVLEHIKDDLIILKKMKNHLKKKGLVYLYVPANMKLWSELDVTVGHYRRYEKKSLVAKLKKAGFKVKKIYYADSLGYLATILWKVKNITNKTKFASKKSLIFYDKFIFPISRFLDNLGLKFILGKNLIAIAEKT